MSMDHGAEGQVNVHDGNGNVEKGPVQSVSSALLGFFIDCLREQSFLLHPVKKGRVLCLFDSTTQTG